MPQWAAEREMMVQFEGQNFKDFVVCPAGKQKAPAVMIWPDVRGDCYANSFAAAKAREIADMGYVGVVVNPYSEEQFPQAARDEKSFPKAFESMNSILRYPGKLRALMNAHVEGAKAQVKEVDGSNLAAIGFCFGGTTVLDCVRGGAPFKGVVSFHGLMDCKPIKMPGMHPDNYDDSVKEPPNNTYANKGIRVLVEHGAKDPLVSADSVTRFKAEMDKNQIEWSWHEHSRAKHAFTTPDGGNPNEMVGYDPNADRASTASMKELFADIFPHALPSPNHTWLPKQGPMGKL